MRRSEWDELFRRPAGRAVRPPPALAVLVLLGALGAVVATFESPAGPPLRAPEFAVPAPSEEPPVSAPAPPPVPIRFPTSTPVPVVAVRATPPPPVAPPAAPVAAPTPAPPTAPPAPLAPPAATRRGKASRPRVAHRKADRAARGKASRSDQRGADSTEMSAASKPGKGRGGGKR